MPYKQRRITRFASSSFQLAMVYMVVVCATMLGLYFYSAKIVSDINEMAGGDVMYESFIFGKLAPLVLLVMIVIAALSFFISEFVIKRINTIQKTAAEIMQTGDLSRRIPIENEWDDLSKMAMTLNDMLHQIEVLLQDVRTVSDNIAHDLRTPLTRLHSHLELMNKPAVQTDKDAVREVAELSLNEAEALLATFQALLRISNIEHGKRHAELCDVRLHRVVEDVLDLYEPLASEKGIGLEVSLTETPAFCADPHLLFQALANLMDNAVKYTPEGGMVAVRLTESPEQLTVEIEDSGGGMPEAELEKAFTRFYRAESARHSPGSGLGLSLVKAVAELHGGSVRLANISRGLRAIFTLPLIKPPT